MFELSLLNLVSSSLLTENRIDDAKKLAQKKGYGDDLFNSIVEFSTKVNPNHKYLQWLVNQSHNLLFDDDLFELLSYFERNNAKFNKKDINQYVDKNELEAAVLKVSNQIRREIEIVPGTTEIYNDSNFIVLVPENHSSSCYYGAGTKWCTASNDNASFYRNYRKSGELYYIISRTKPSSDTNYKMAVRMVFDDGTNFPPTPKIAEIRDAQDDLITEKTLIDNSSENVLTAISEDFKFKWDLWWNDMEDTLRQKHQAESERQAYERAQRAEQEQQQRQREAARRLERRNEAQQRREDGEYEDNDEVHALHQYLISIGDWEEGDDEEQFDIYYLFLEGYTHYGLSVYTNELDDKEWAIGTDDEADQAAHDQVENFIEEFKDQPNMGFSPGFIEYYIDEEQVVSEFESRIEDDIRESPDSYLNDDDKTITEEGQRLLDEVNDKISELEEHKTRMEEEIEDLTTQLSDLDEDSSEYNEVQDKINEIESDLSVVEDEISDLETEIDDINEDSDNFEWSEEAIERAVQDRLEDFRNYPIRELNNWGITDLSRYVNEDDLINGVIVYDGRGSCLSGYDGNENEITYNGTTYYIYRIN